MLSAVWPMYRPCHLCAVGEQKDCFLYSEESTMKITRCNSYYCVYESRYDMLLVAPAVVNRNLLDGQEITLSWWLQRYFIAGDDQRYRKSS